MMKHITCLYYWLLSAVVISLAGCNHTVALPALDTNPPPSLSQGQLVLASLELHTRAGMESLPPLTQVEVIQTRPSIKAYDFIPHLVQHTTYSNRYLLSFALPTGSYQINRILSGSPSQGIRWMIPIHAGFNVHPEGIVYIGQLSVEFNPLTGTQTTAQNPLQVVDQFIEGYPPRTYTVSVQDRYQKDMREWVKIHPILAGQPVYKSILLPITPVRSNSLVQDKSTTSGQAQSSTIAGQ